MMMVKEAIQERAGGGPSFGNSRLLICWLKVMNARGEPSTPGNTQATGLAMPSDAVDAAECCAQASLERMRL